MRTLLVLSLVLGPPAFAQQPDTLLHTLSDPSTAAQSGPRQGSSVAVDGGLIAIGAPFDDIGGEDSGVVKVYERDTGGLLHVLVNPVATRGKRFGISVAISGSWVVVGAHFDLGDASAPGSAYVYDLSSAIPTEPVATLNNPGPTEGDGFGHSVGISGTRVVIGEPWDVNSQFGPGRAYVYDLTSATPTVPAAVLDNPSPDIRDYFGDSVAISGTQVVVGVPYDATGEYEAGRAYVFDLASETPRVPVAALNNPGPGRSDWFGRSVAISGMRIVVGAPKDDTGTFDAGSAYLYDLASVTPTVPVATLNNPSPDRIDNFGHSVAISGTRVVVGAYGDGSAAPNAGSAYAYELTGAMPTVPVVTFNNPNPASGDSFISDQFGISVAVSGTGVVVGAPYDDPGANNAGNAYVYDLAGATPRIPVAALNSPSPAAFHRFGNSVGLSGTGLVVGAPYDDTPGPESGTAYVYDLASPTPAAPMARLNNPSPSDHDWFGHSVGISGTRVVVGSPYDDTGAPDAGSAYAYDLTSATPTVPVATLNNPTPANLAYDNRFGSSVAVSGTRVVVGAPHADVGERDSAGKAYVFDLASPTPTSPVATLNKPGPATSDWFGHSVALSGTLVVVGTPYDDTGADDAGSAYVYDMASSTPTVPVATLHHPDPAQFDWFGASVAISGSWVAIGAPYEDDAGRDDAGKTYLFNVASATPTVPVATLRNPTPAENDRFGNAVAISGMRVLVGAYQDDGGDADAGRAYVFDVAGATPTMPVAILHNPTPHSRDESGDEFGHSVAIDGATAAVGVPYEDGTTADRGATYIFAPASPDFDGDGLLDIWEYAHFGSISTQVALDDTDYDGRTELMEQAFDTNPLRTDPPTAPPHVTGEDRYLTVTISKRAGVIYTVETAGSLNGAAFSTVDTTTLTNDATTLKVRDNFTPATAAQRFLRVNVRPER